MSLERRLRDHFGAAAQRLPEPPDSLAEVSRRGRRRRTVERTAAALAVLVVLAAIPLAWRALDESTVEFVPVAPPTETPTPGPTPPPEATPSPDERPEPTPTVTADDEPAPEPATIGELRAPVLGYGPSDHDELALMDHEGAQVLLPGPVDAAFPDGRGGAVLKLAGQPAARWVADPVEPVDLPLADVDGELTLRGLMPDGRVLYSVRAAEPPGEGAEEQEEFFAVDLTDDPEPELVASTVAYESRTIGPAFAADGQPIHAGCHLHCSLWPGLAEPPEGAEPLYHGGGGEGPAAAIEGLTATPDGLVLALVEHDPTFPEGYDERPPELVLLAGTSFDELGRIPLPFETGEENVGQPVVSLSADGQRVLVAIGAGAPPANAPPTTPYLVEGALTDDPQVRPVDFTGALRWADPVAAAGPGGPVTATERDTAERLVAFAQEPNPDTFDAVPFAAEVSLGLGPDLVGAPRPAGELADRDVWQLEREDFRARVGPFSALDLLADAGATRIAGGPHMHCASPPTPVPGQIADLRQISIQATGIDSCLDWFTVDLFLTDDGEIAAVTLDLYEP